ncbi:unnamed protein product [Camellia sinensis]
MDPEEVLNLFDSYWFNLEIFKKPPHISNSETNPNHQNQENNPEPKISSLPTIHVRSKSDQLMSTTGSFSSDSLSPDSVLSSTPHLQTILSGFEATKEEEPAIKQKQPKKIRSMRRRTNKGMTKSLSSLEFEELKGFMDLGFVFSEEDVNSSLVEIIPGLHRLAKKDDGEEQVKEISSSSAFDESSIPRPYLSEAWEVWERERRENPLMNWRVPALGNEIDIKDSLKWWAHTVASTVR